MERERETTCLWCVNHRQGWLFSECALDPKWATIWNARTHSCSHHKWNKKALLEIISEGKILKRR